MQTIIGSKYFAYIYIVVIQENNQDDYLELLPLRKWDKPVKLVKSTTGPSLILDQMHQNWLECAAKERKKEQETKYMKLDAK